MLLYLFNDKDTAKIIFLLVTSYTSHADTKLKNFKIFKTIPIGNKLSLYFSISLIILYNIIGYIGCYSIPFDYKIFNINIFYSNI